jgi:hypothetical protein
MSATTDLWAISTNAFFSPATLMGGPQNRFGRRKRMAQ